MIKFSKHMILLIFLTLCIGSFFVVNYIFSQNTIASGMWKYECIDTMKVSRDQARSLGTGAAAQKEITKEITIIKSLGANCIAIDTPYDEEFVPYLTLWVHTAHSAHLHVWFRGNFSSWEGWFSYPKGMSTQEHLAKTHDFIINHAQLFTNGDIFTPAPEAENGWANGDVQETDYPQFRQFLIDERQNAQQTFDTINKKVITNWLSMNGDVAKKVLDKSTLQALDNTVTIDHYVNSPAEMRQYIDYFTQTYHAKVVIGEFGAPIPDINGPMNAQQQNDFVASIFNVLYQEGNNIEGVNYWVLKDGTTSLIDQSDMMKPVANTIKQYYIPVQIKGTVTDELGDAVIHATVISHDTDQTMMTNEYGQYNLKTYRAPSTITVKKAGYTVLQQAKTIKNNQVTYTTILKPDFPNMSYIIRLHIKHFLSIFSRNN